MIKILQKATFFIILIFVTSCSTNKNVNKTKVNTYPNSNYNKSRESYYGTLNKIEYNELMTKLQLVLKTTFSANKSILINYNQRAPNCISLRFSKDSNERVVKNRIRISSQMSSDYNAIDFFVYTQDSYHNEIYEKSSKFILDTGFFYDNIFTEHQNCAGFLIVKPDGKFYKYYGEDYYSEVKTFLEE